ncbi:hypothetical protein MIMGU_mgv1a022978mg [Erythranthe guttata]|uniref:Mechanosensitive ion channel MscS domain-containing protein n=1 Tax=Erythranthe guttata TaxID=4155 RepID=A0A022PZU0_ERYGU|nr:hypothetical protein MIMGU_mgv1a022978mg [Erythranthe guttata]
MSSLSIVLPRIQNVTSHSRVPTAFASKYIHGSVLSGLDVQNSKQFSMGDTIKVGNEESELVNMDLKTASIVTSEGLAISIPNSMFSTQEERAVVKIQKIHLQTDDMEKISQISENINSALRSNPNVFLEKEAPYCILSYIEEGSQS